MQNISISKAVKSIFARIASATVCLSVLNCSTPQKVKNKDIQLQESDQLSQSSSQNSQAQQQDDLQSQSGNDSPSNTHQSGQGQLADGEDIQYESDLPAGSQQNDTLYKPRVAPIANASALTGFLHPKKPTAWMTRKLIMLSVQPHPGAIQNCKDTADSLSAKAFNLRSIDEAALRMQSSIRQNPQTFHWCFYQLMADLDLKLERNDVRLLEEQASLFMTRMKSMWVLARALDSTIPSIQKTKFRETYLTYLRARYIQISQNHFGRSIEIIDPASLSVTAGKSGKPAAEYNDAH